MARHNEVFLYGQIISEPRNSDKKIMFCLNIIRGIRDFGDNISELKYDAPIIMSFNPEIIAIAKDFKKGDMVEVKGTITTKEVNKSALCPHCGHKTIAQGTIVFINPIYISKREEGVSHDEGLMLLKKRVEISNTIKVIGRLCRDPEHYVSKTGKHVTQYQLAVNRKFHIKEDSTEVRTDYPWVKSYGNVAVEDAKFLKTGSLVYIDGMLQSRKVERTSTCESCGESFVWHDNALEIVPYAVEYLQDYITPEEYEQKEEEENKAIIENVFK